MHACIKGERCDAIICGGLAMHACIKGERCDAIICGGLAMHACIKGVLPAASSSLMLTPALSSVCAMLAMCMWSVDSMQARCSGQ